MKRLVSLFLALVMVLSMSAALAEVTYPLTTEPVTITIAVAQHNSDAVEDFNTKYAIKQAEEVTGVHIEWIPLQEGNTTEKVATMLAGDLPDVFLGLLNDSSVAQNPSLFVTLEDKIEEYCPNIYATYEESVDGWRTFLTYIYATYEESVDGWRTFLTYPDGHIYGLIANYRANPNNAINGTMWINKVWLDNLGLEMPTTLKELEEVLVAFRDQDADGDGDPNNEIPWDWCQKYYAAKWAEVAFMFGSTMGSRGGGMYDIVDGKVTPAAREENFREALEYMNYLCKEGLMNIEGITQSSDQYNANVDSGKVGVFTEWTRATHITSPELREQYVYVGPLSAEGHTFRTMPGVLTANRNGFVITSACENVELALQWWDYMSRDVAATHAARSGPEGLTWEMIDGVPTNRTYTAEDAIAFGYESIAQHAGTSVFAASMGLTNCPPMIVDSLAPAPGGDPQSRANAVKTYQPYFTEQSMSQGIVPTEAQEEYDFTCEGLVDHINAFAAESIMNGVTDDSWNAYLKKLDSLNYDYYIEFHQKKLDGNWN